MTQILSRFEETNSHPAAKTMLVLLHERVVRINDINNVRCKRCRRSIPDLIVPNENIEDIKSIDYDYIDLWL